MDRTLITTRYLNKHSFKVSIFNVDIDVTYQKIQELWDWSLKKKKKKKKNLIGLAKLLLNFPKYTNGSISLATLSLMLHPPC